MSFNRNSIQNLIKKLFFLSKTPPNYENYTNTKMAIVVRNDIKMTKGKIASQCAHAAILCYQKAQNESSNLLKNWCRLGQPKIVLRTDSYNELQDLYKSAKNENVIAELVKDAGRTQLIPGTVTVIGIGPDHVEKIDRIVKHLKLL